MLLLQPVDSLISLLHQRTLPSSELTRDWVTYFEPNSPSLFQDCSPEISDSFSTTKLSSGFVIRIFLHLTFIFTLGLCFAWFVSLKCLWFMTFASLFCPSRHWCSQVSGLPMIVLVSVARIERLVQRISLFQRSTLIWDRLIRKIGNVIWKCLLLAWKTGFFLENLWSQSWSRYSLDGRSIHRIQFNLKKSKPLYSCQPSCTFVPKMS